MARGLGALQNSISRLAQSQFETGQVIAKAFNEFNNFKDKYNAIELSNEVIRVQQELINSYDENTYDEESFQVTVRDQKDLIIDSNLSLNNKRQLLNNIEEKSFELKRNIRLNIYKKQLAEEQALAEEQQKLKEQELKRLENTLTNILNSSDSPETIEIEYERSLTELENKFKSGEISQLEYSTLFTGIQNTYQKRQNVLADELEAKYEEINTNRRNSYIASMIDDIEVASKGDPILMEQMFQQQVISEIENNDELNIFQKESAKNTAKKTFRPKILEAKKNRVKELDKEFEQQNIDKQKSLEFDFDNRSRSGEIISNEEYNELQVAYENQGKSQLEAQRLVAERKQNDILNNITYNINKIESTVDDNKISIEEGIDSYLKLAKHLEIKELDSQEVKTIKKEKQIEIRSKILKLEAKKKTETKVKREKYNQVVSNYDVTIDNLLTGKRTYNSEDLREEMSILKSQKKNMESDLTPEEIKIINEKEQEIYDLFNFANMTEEQQNKLINSVDDFKQRDKYIAMKASYDKVKIEDPINYEKNYRKVYDVADLKNGSVIESLLDIDFLSNRFAVANASGSKFFLTKDETKQLATEIETAAKEDPEKLLKLYNVGSVLKNESLLEQINKENPRIANFILRYKRGADVKPSTFYVSKDLYKTHPNYDKEYEDVIINTVNEKYSYLPQSMKNKIADDLRYDLSAEIDKRTELNEDINFESLIIQLSESNLYKTTNFDDSWFFGKDKNIITPHNKDNHLKDFYNFLKNDDQILINLVNGEITIEGDFGTKAALISAPMMEEFAFKLPELIRDGMVELTNIRNPKTGEIVYAFSDLAAGEKSYIKDEEGNIFMFSLPAFESNDFLADYDGNFLFSKDNRITRAAKAGLKINIIE